jgi:hypothetical protein
MDLALTFQKVYSKCRVGQSDEASLNTSWSHPWRVLVPSCAENASYMGAVQSLRTEFWVGADVMFFMDVAKGDLSNFTRSIMSPNKERVLFGRKVQHRGIIGF